MEARHEEYTGVIAASVDSVFAHLDDQTRLSAHMKERSWKLGWGKMEIRLDAQGGKAVGSHIVLEGRVFGIPLYLDEVVTERDPPQRKRWQTVGEPRLLVIGGYTMGFDVFAADGGTRVTVSIDYELPAHGFSRLLGHVFGRMYAQWCTRQMVQDAERAFARTASGQDSAEQRIRIHS